MTTRQERTRELIQIGGLAEIAGIAEMDKGAILGLLLEASQRIKDETVYKHYKRLGDAELNRRAQARKLKQNPKKNAVGMGM